MKTTSFTTCSYCHMKYTDEYKVCPNCSSTELYEKVIYDGLRKARDNLKPQQFQNLVSTLETTCRVQYDMSVNPDKFKGLVKIMRKEDD